MAAKSHIEWTETTWNPVTGCSKVSQGCKHCYAERMASRLQAMGLPRYSNGFELTTHDDLIELPKRWKTPRVIFVNSMSDLFHEEVPHVFIERVFRTMAECPQHRFQLLTKRARRLADVAGSLRWSANIWMGVSVESQRVIERISFLRKVPAEIRFLSLEPLLGPMPKLPLEGIHWVIVGGESGPGARRMREEWVNDILAQCRTGNVSFFFKQWGGVKKSNNGRELGGRTYDEFPHGLELKKLARG
jgi:protein gp37